MIKGTLRSKTIWLGLIIGIFGAVLATMPLFLGTMDQQTYGFIFMGLSIAVVILRFYTKLPLDQK